MQRKRTLRAILAGAMLPTMTLPTLVFADDCSLPELPAIPDGKSATYDEMIAGQQAIKQFQAGAEAFRSCLDDVMKDMKIAAEEGDEDAASLFASANDRYNASVTSEEALAEEFNGSIKAYKAANTN